MSYLVKMSEEFEKHTEYLNSISEPLRSLQGLFPSIGLRSFDDFKSFLDRYLPSIVRKYLVGTKSVKNCSGISPDFSEFAAHHGFAVLTENVPGHVRNIFLSSSAPYLVDLSYIQFSCGADNKSVMKILEEVYHNPYKAVKIDKLPVNYFGNYSYPKGEYDGIYNPVEDITSYDEDKDRQEEDLSDVVRYNKSRQ